MLGKKLISFDLFAEEISKVLLNIIKFDTFEYKVEEIYTLLQKI